MILILADSFDAHADVVEQHLKASSAVYFRLNLDVHSLQKSHLHFDGEHWRLEQDGSTVISALIQCVWPRRLTVSLSLEQQTTIESSAFRLWRSEWNRSLYGFYSSLRDTNWMNGIAQSSLAENKFFQMQKAKQHGFCVPDTISSNYKNELISFAERHKFVAVKFMSQDIYLMEDGSYSGIYVNRVKPEDLVEFNDFEENPIVLQKYIEKSYEVRHTFVSGSHFSCKIDSQMSNRASIDWRRYDIPNTPHSSIDAPKDILRKVESLMDDLGLSYGAFDFIVDTHDQWWYLEVNSAGQWLWIEDLADMPISAAIAQSLMARASREV
jgi:glutathione synthase/RimK-type ligase-like ATP-grasp enzyme